ncbi:hypothetical protein B0J11DRAFT_599734 [Dendryphion nanum]|uniref:Nephrocystin 3-like N-terminal domain-containing protein n=1 Tax=Dendryphion nanum TaxID=256645 RepID=A0A9P9D024_9PLEO|nr:hypothetical protein B0J11DRAFT_599734 [Dendryphion nanum]
MWTPVDVRFKDILESLPRHRRLMREDLLLLQAKAVDDAEALARDEYRRSADERLRAEESRLKISRIEQQTSEMKARLTLEGKEKRAPTPGSRQYRHSKNGLIYIDSMNFFLHLSVLVQMSSRYTRLLDKIAFCKINGTGQPRASQTELIGLIQLCVQEIEHVYFIFDGVDECSDGQALLKAISYIASFSTTRVLLSSRPIVLQLHQSTREEQRLSLRRRHIKEDIRTYFSHKIATLVEDGYLEQDPVHTLDALVEPLVSGADGMFLWATPMIKLLRSPVLCTSRRHKIITDIIHPEGLDKMYDRVLLVIAESGTLERNTAKQIFYWLAFATRPVLQLSNEFLRDITRLVRE